MPCPGTLRTAALLLPLCLQLQGHLPAAAAPLPLGEEVYPGQAPPKTQALTVTASQMTQDSRALPETDPDQDRRDDLFQDVDPKALAAVLLQALRPLPENSDRGAADLEPSANEERVRSETKSSELPPEREPAWKGGEGGSQSLEEEEAPDQEAEALQTMLQELRRYSSTEERPQERRAAASTPPESARNDVLRELEEYEQLRVHPKRKPPPSESWEGARKLRQQQHLEHQLLQRRYEELAESRRQAEEARRAAAEEERLADMASDLLLQYLLKDGEQSGEEGQQGAPGGGRQGSSALLFEDEEGNVAEDKRSNEAPEDEQEEGQEDDIDPSTIDRLIELSSKLHLPADDVIDIINDVEKKEEEEPPPQAVSRSKTPATFAPQEKPKKTPPYPAHSPSPKRLQKPWQPPRRLPPKEDEDAWNEVLRGDEYPAAPPKWFWAKPNDDVISNYISPRTFQPPTYHRHAHLPSPLGMPWEEHSSQGARGRQEEAALENYLENVLLMKRPKGF